MKDDDDRPDYIVADEILDLIVAHDVNLRRQVRRWISLSTPSPWRSSPSTSVTRISVRLCGKPSVDP